MPRIDVMATKQTTGGTEVTVSVIEGTDRTVHHVLVEPGDLRRLGAIGSSAEDAVIGLFGRLLAGTSSDDIPARFAVRRLLDEGPPAGRPPGRARVRAVADPRRRTF